MKKKIVLVIQARLTSSRFPGKVLKKIKNKTLVEIIYSRLKKLKIPNHLIFAIPKNKNNLKLKKFLIEKNIPFGLGPEKNVLKRIFNVCLNFNPDIVVRLTCDCPLLDHKILKLMLKKFFTLEDIDYMSNTTITKKKFPDGMDIEIFKYKALKKAFYNAKTAYEKEHVTPYIQNHCKTFSYESKIDFSGKRWTVDTYSDFLKIKKIFATYDFNFNVGYKKILEKF